VRFPLVDSVLIDGEAIVVGRMGTAIFATLRMNRGAAQASLVSRLRLSKERKRRSVPRWRATCQMRAHMGICPQGTRVDVVAMSVARRLAQAACKLPTLADGAISPRTIRHTTAMHLLQLGWTSPLSRCGSAMSTCVRLGPTTMSRSGAGVDHWSPLKVQVRCWMPDSDSALLSDRKTQR
jgi:hypothetical protein